MKLLFNNETNEDLKYLIGDIENIINIGLDLEEIKEDLEISLTITDNQTIRELNKAYRGIDKETDVLSFPLWNGEFENDNLLGDIVISLDKIKSQSLEYGHSFEREFLYIVIHSLLHLLGYDHMEDEDKKIMRAKEKLIIRRGTYEE